MHMDLRIQSLLKNRGDFKDRCNGCHTRIEVGDDYAGSTAGKKNSKRFCLKCAKKYGLMVVT